MNRNETLFRQPGEARVRYGNADYKILADGAFVVCAVSGERIALTDLRYWSVELQEPYASAEISFRRHCAHRGVDLTGWDAARRDEDAGA